MDFWSVGRMYHIKLLKYIEKCEMKCVMKKYIQSIEDRQIYVETFPYSHTSAIVKNSKIYQHFIFSVSFEIVLSDFLFLMGSLPILYLHDNFKKALSFILSYLLPDILLLFSLEQDYKKWVYFSDACIKFCAKLI